MIEIKLKDIADNIELLNDFSQKKLPASAAYKAARILGQVTTEYNLYQKARTDLIEKYCARNEDGSMKMEGSNVIIKPECIQECEKELQDLVETTIMINATPLKLSEVEHLDFTPAQMYMMQTFIEE